MVEVFKSFFFFLVALVSCKLDFLDCHFGAVAFAEEDAAESTLTDLLFPVVIDEPNSCWGIGGAQFIHFLDKVPQYAQPFVIFRLD